MPARPIGTPALRRRAERMLGALSLAEAELSILVCDDAAMRALNRQHRRLDRPTDVLAFALREGERLRGGDALLGDIVISLETAQRQADEHGRTLWDEVTLLLAHGLLHLIGYDHDTVARERRMNARTDMLRAAAARAPQRAAPTVDKGRKAGDSERRRRVLSHPRRGPKRA